MNQYAKLVSENCLQCQKYAEKVGISGGEFSEIYKILNEAWMDISDNFQQISRNYLKLTFPPKGGIEKSELAKYTKICEGCDRKKSMLSEAMENDGFLA